MDAAPLLVVSHIVTPLVFALTLQFLVDHWPRLSRRPATGKRGASAEPKANPRPGR